MKFYSIILFIGVIFSQSGYDIAKLISNRKSPQDIKSVLVMTLIDKRGNTLESQLISYTKDNSQKQMIWFTSPPEDRGISLYKIENEKGKDLMKMWLPAFKKIRKISSRKKSEFPVKNRHSATPTNPPPSHPARPHPWPWALPPRPASEVAG